MTANQTKSARTETAPRVLLYDLETSPNIAYVWGKYEQDALGDFIKERQIISVAWKWLDEKEVHCLALPMLPTYKKKPDDNRGIILKLHELFSRADVVVGHNVDSFDDPMSNAEFLKYGLPPTPPHRSIDTLKFARHKFRFNSNKLGDLGKMLKLGAKVHTGGFQLWADCPRGDQKAWAKMTLYNMGDVSLLEKVYLKMRPWMKNHPNLNDGLSGLEGAGCPVCGSKKYEGRGTVHFVGGFKHRFKCLRPGCGKWFRGSPVKGEWKYKS